MAEVEYIGDFEARVRSKVLSQYRDAPRLCALAQGLGAAVQQHEDAFIALSSDALYLNATGVRLDLYGALVGEDRNGLNDLLYHRVISARVLANRSQGTEDEMWGILRTLVPDGTGEISATALYPATIYLTVSTTWRPELQFLARVSKILRLAKSGGVSLGGSWAVEVAFGFDSNPAILGSDQGQLAYAI